MNSSPTNFWEWLAPIEASERFALCMTSIVIGLIALVLVVGIVVHTTGKIHRVRLENSLKRELLDRGMSCKEIAWIIEASAAPKAPRSKIQERHCGKGDEHAYVT